MSEEQLIQSGIAAARAGEMQRANALFAEVVKQNPSSERGWYLLGMTCAAPEQRAYCMRRVLALNPNNADAARQLGAGASDAPPSPKPAEAKAPAPVTATAGKPQDQEGKSPEKKPVKANPKRKQKPNTTQTLILSALGGLLLLICGGVGAYAFFARASAPVVEAEAEQPAAPAESPTPAAPPAYMPTATAESAPTALPTPMPTLAYAPVLERTPCTLDLPKDVEANCGFVVVPEDRTANPSDTVRLAFVTYKSMSANPDPTPVVFLQGGPGAEAVTLSAEGYAEWVVPFLADRDFIAFDQRGTGLSTPALKCDELTKTYSQDIHGMLEKNVRKMVYANAFNSCGGLLSAQGVNVKAYTTAASAADLKDLLSVLGYPKAHLYGASYGTRLALVTMRDYPEIVASAILDSVVPVEANMFTEYPLAVDSALRALFDTCAASPECNGAYPDLEAVYGDLVQKLNAEPITVTTSVYPIGTVTQSVNGSTLTSIVLGSLKSSRLLRTAAQTIYRVRDGDYSTLIAAQYAQPFAFDGINPGLYVAVACHEHILAASLDDLRKVTERADMKEYALLPFYGEAEDIFTTCTKWGVTPPFYGENNPTVSDLPALIITGKYDSATPPFYGRQIAANLSRSYYFEFPNRGHTPTASGGCALDVALTFLQNPAVEPSRDCLNAQPQAQFLVPYKGEAPIPLQKTRIMDVINAGVPAAWDLVEEGRYARSSSLLDITQLAVFGVEVDIANLKSWFSSSAYGYRGLDTPLVSTGQREAGGYTWKLYTSTSEGRPVDIAMAEYYYGTSLVVMMFSHNDERDALYQNLFVPVVDSIR